MYIRLFRACQLEVSFNHIWNYLWSNKDHPYNSYCIVSYCVCQYFTVILILFFICFIISQDVWVTYVPWLIQNHNYSILFNFYSIIVSDKEFINMLDMLCLQIYDVTHWRHVEHVFIYNVDMYVEVWHISNTPFSPM